MILLGTKGIKIFAFNATWNGELKSNTQYSITQPLNQRLCFSSTFQFTVPGNIKKAFLMIPETVYLLLINYSIHRSGYNYKCLLMLPKMVNWAAD